jgi:23S rRNA (pseudouridine1915-N3)-methyltransferase
MKTSLVCVGKTNEKYLKDGIKIYTNRLKHYCNFSFTEIPDIRKSKKTDINVLKQQEGLKIMQILKPDSRIILLDERGNQMTSEKFSQTIHKHNTYDPRDLIFVIGGAYGFSNEMYKAADRKIALSAMTFSHQMVRLIFVEQLYRAYTIINNEPYHHQ